MRTPGTVSTCTGEGLEGHQEEFTHRGGDQAWEQAAQGGGVSIPIGIQEIYGCGTKGRGSVTRPSRSG